MISNIVFDADKTCVRKLTTISTQAEIQTWLEDFLMSNSTNVCLLIADMQHVSTRIINHVRILVEELERVTECSSNKVFFLLLCLTPKQFFYPPYPSFFLKGWEHYYLDTIGSSNSFDIQDWLRNCLHVGTHQNTFLLKHLHEMLEDVIAHLLSSVNFDCDTHAQRCFNCPMKVPKREQLLHEILKTKGVYTVLCEKFCAYWTPQMMLKCMQDAARVSISRKSMVSMAESVKGSFRNYFINFFTYMMLRINRDFYLDILCNEPYCKVVLEPFKDILRELPVPDLPQIGSGVSYSLSRSITRTPIFPFFTYIRDQMDELLERSKKRISEKRLFLGETSLPLVSGDNTFHQSLIEELSCEIEVRLSYN